MLINTETYNRHLLTYEAKTFLKKLVPLSYVVSQWTFDKGLFLNIDTPRGILPSIILADILLMSKNGTHPVSQEDCNSKYSNNLALIQSDRYWTGKSNIYEGKSYCAFKTWRDFAETYSDHLTFSRLYDNALSSPNVIDQAAHLQIAKLEIEREKDKNLDILNPTCYSSKEIITIIASLGLEEFDQIIFR